MNRIRFCENCRIYTLEEKCKICGRETVIRAPIKYVKNDSISKYRREIKMKERLEKGLI